MNSGKKFDPNQASGFFHSFNFFISASNRSICEYYASAAIRTEIQGIQNIRLPSKQKMFRSELYFFY